MRWPWRRRPRLGPGDLLSEAEIHHADGRVERIILVMSTDGTVRGYDRPIDLPAGSSLAFNLPYWMPRGDGPDDL